MIRHIAGMVWVRQSSNRSAHKPEVQRTSLKATGWIEAAIESSGTRAKKKIKLEVRSSRFEANSKMEIRNARVKSHDGILIVPFPVLRFEFVSNFDIRI